jgi:hypothetical protein
MVMAEKKQLVHLSAMASHHLELEKISVGAKFPFTWLL